MSVKRVTGGPQDSLLTSTLPLPAISSVRDLLALTNCPEPSQGSERSWSWGGRVNSALRFTRNMSDKHPTQHFNVTLPQDNLGDLAFIVFLNGTGKMENHATFNADRFPRIPESTKIIFHSIITARSTVLNTVTAINLDGEQTDVTTQYFARKTINWDWNQ